MESITLPSSLKNINTYTIYDPDITILRLQRMQNVLMAAPSITTFFPTLKEEIEKLISDCHKMLKGSHRLTRKLNQNVQQCLTQRNYHNLIQTIEMYMNDYPISAVAQQAVTMVKKLILYCDGMLLDFTMMEFERLQLFTAEYHHITSVILPGIKLCTNDLQLIYTSLQTGSSMAKRFIFSRQHDKEFEKIETDHLAKIREVAPNFVDELIAKDNWRSMFTITA